MSHYPPPCIEHPSVQDWIKREANTIRTSAIEVATLHRQYNMALCKAEQMYERNLEAIQDIYKACLQDAKEQGEWQLAEIKSTQCALVKQSKDIATQHNVITKYKD